MGWYKDKNGNPVWVDDSAPRTVPIGPQNPAFQYQGPKAAGEVRGQTLNNQGQALDNQITQATLPAAIRKANADAKTAEIGASTAQRDFDRGPKLSEAEINASEEMRGKISRLAQLAGQIDRVDQLYREGPGKTPWYQGFVDFLPTAANKRLDVAGAQLSQQGLGAFRVPGTGNVSDRDAIMFDRGNLPTASTMDAGNEEILYGLRARVNEELKSMGQPARWDDQGNPIGENDRALQAAQARLEAQIANLPPQAQEIGRQRFYADPRIKRLMGKQGTAGAPRKQSNVIDFNQWGN